MGIFSEFKSTFKKSESILLLKSMFDQHKSIGLLEDVNTEKLAERLVSDVWQSKPDIFDGAFGQRPHKMAVAAAALAYSLDNLELERNRKIRLSIQINLGNLLSEIQTNGRLYPFNSLDVVLIESAVDTLSTHTAEPARESNEYYSSYEDWYVEFKRVCAMNNSQLALNDEGRSFVDFMEQGPLRRAYNDGVHPGDLADSFAAQFDLKTFGK